LSKTNEFNFTKRAIENLSVPDSGRARYLDTGTRGLGVVVQPSGEKSFYWFRKVRGYPRWETLGRFPDLTVEQARDAAEERNNRLAKWKANRYEGKNPFERRDEVTLDRVLDEYVEKQVKQHSKRPERAEKDVRSLVARYMAPWRNRPLSAIRREDVAEMHRKIGAKYHRTANVAVKTLKTLYSFAEREQLYSGANPARGIQPYHEPHRTRYLLPDEFPKLGAALDKTPNPDLRDAVGLALTTGARKMNVLSMRWVDISLEHNVWQIVDSKNRTPYQVPLTEQAVAILKNRLRARVGDSPWVFPSYRRTKTGHLTDLKKRWNEALKDAGLDRADLRFHDLRRTQGSIQAAQGTSLLIIGKSLGHQSVSATQIYSQVNLDAVRQSMAAANKTMSAMMKKRPKLLAAPTKTKKAAGHG
jgi:integrase